VHYVPLADSARTDNREPPSLLPYLLYPGGFDNKLHDIFQSTPASSFQQDNYPMGEDIVPQADQCLVAHYLKINSYLCTYDLYSPDPPGDFNGVNPREVKGPYCGGWRSR
jgi:hypothetical protein